MADDTDEAVDLVQELTAQIDESQDPPEDAPETPTPEQEPEAAGAVAPEEPTGDDAFFSYMKDTHGLDFGGKYTSMKDALDGLASGYRMRGQHDEDAKLGRQLRENPQEIFRQLSQHAEPQQPPQQETFVPIPFDEFESVARMIRENPEAVDPTLQDRFEKTARHMARMNYEKAFTQDAGTEQIASQVLQQVQQMLVQRDQQQARQSADIQQINQWDAANHDAMWTKDNQLTPFGEAWKQQMHAPDSYGVSPHEMYQRGQLSLVQAAEYAKSLVIAKQTSSTVAPPPPRAEHKPNVANPAPASGDPNTWDDDKESFLEFAARSFSGQ
jgi:hypothetical protein